MKVCLVNALFHPFSGGIEKHMYELSRELASLDVDVTVVTGQIDDAAACEDLDGFRVRRVPCKAIKAPLLYPPPLVLSPLFYYHLKKLDKEEHFDIIHLHNRFFFDFNMASLYVRIKKKPFVMTAHNPRPDYVGAPVGTLGMAYDWSIGRWPLILADRVIAVSEWTKYDIARYGVDTKKIVTIHNGVNTVEFKPGSGERAREKYEIGDGFMLLFVGRMVPQKGISYLIKAMPLILERHPGTKLVLVGTGSHVSSLQKEAAAMGLANRVVFTGHLPDDELREAYDACDVFVLPSIVEPFGLVVVEAMASGKPVVCTDSGGVREIVADGINGFLVPPRDPEALARQINILLDDPDMRERMGAAGRRRAETEFDWKSVAEQTKRVYEDLLGEPARPNT